MGGLAHTLEQEGLATTQISLIRKHTEIIRPPRALWVPFDLGRPLGAPNDPSFQRRVLLAALELLDRTHGPVLVDFPEEAPPEEIEEGWACPVPLPPQPDDQTGGSALAEAVQAEIALLKPWHDQSQASTLAGEIDTVAAWLIDFAEGRVGPSPYGAASAAVSFKQGTEDLKSFYFEAAGNQPGRSGSMAALNDWFWDETAAAQLLRALQPVCLASDDPAVREVAQRFLLPWGRARA